MNLNFVQFLKDKGNSPVKLLLRKCSVRIDRKEPNEFGICPENLLFSKLRTTNLSHCAQQLGSPPVNELFERSSRTSGGLTTAHNKEMDPDNLLLERSNHRTSEGSCGIKPSK